MGLIILLSLFNGLTRLPTSGRVGPDMAVIEPNSGSDNFTYILSYDPISKTCVFRISGNFSCDISQLISQITFLSKLEIKETKVLSNGCLLTQQLKANNQTLLPLMATLEVEVPLTSDNIKLLNERFDLPLEFFAATLMQEDYLAEFRIRVMLHNKIDGQWYRLSCIIPSGYRVKGVKRIDGTSIHNIREGNRVEGFTKEETNVYIEGNILYFYDDPIYGYDVTLDPPAPNQSLIIETANIYTSNRYKAGMIGLIGYPYNGGTPGVAIDHSGLDNQLDGIANSIDAFAGSKIAIRRDGLATNYGNPGTNWNNGTTSGNQNYCFNQTARTVTASNYTPDNEIESAIVTQMQTTTQAPQFVVTQKIVLRDNNSWFACVYYIRNNGVVAATNVRFFQGMDWNYNGSYTGDSCAYISTDGLVYGYKSTASPQSYGGYRSNFTPDDWDVNEFSTIWSRIRTDGLANGNSYGGDAATALRWNRATLAAGETWTIPLIWGYHNTYNNMRTLINNAINQELYDVGIEDITSPLDSARINKSQGTVNILCDAAVYGVVDIRNLPIYLLIRTAGGSPVLNTTPDTIDFAIPDTELVQVSYNWNISALDPGWYTITYYTNLGMDQNRSNDSATIYVYIGEFTLDPNQSKETVPGTDVYDTLMMNNGGVLDRFDFTIPTHTSNLVTYLYDFPSILIGRDDNGDGSWDWVATGYDNNTNNQPDIEVPAADSHRVVVRKIVPASTPYGTVDTTNIKAQGIAYSATWDDASLVTIIPPPSGTKQLYLHPDSLNTTIFTGGGSATIGAGSSNFWSQRPYFAKPFTIQKIAGANNDVPIPLYINTSGVNKSINVVLQYYHPSTGTVTLGSQAQNVNTTTPTLINYYIELASSPTIPAGGKMILRIDNPASPAGNIYIYRGNASGQYRSRIELTTTTYIEIDWIKTYRGQSGPEVSVFSDNDSVTTRAELSDPFGSFDIVQARITITNPLGTPVVSDQPMVLYETDPNNPSVWRRYMYSWVVPVGATKGQYTITITGYETNNITVSANKYFSVGNPPTLDWTGEANYTTD
ncbi:MAG: hypothetical protein HY769_07470, partial [Candidatus Stahlbacteria bacterium]|nr:hypothetical protein [Candidatus Stahlbacteria bacterium]